MPLIEFHTTPELLNRIPHPYPAVQQVPEWLKQMPADYDEGGTLKRCPPFLEAMTAGYVIPAPADARLIMSGDGKLEVRAIVDGSDSYIRYLSAHFPAQYEGSPFEKMRVVKFENPWTIVTAPEYVCLITAPINRFQIPFTALTGIVETGTYYREVNLPMVCAMQPGQSFTLHRGAPMIQVIPIRREQWQSQSGTGDPTKKQEQEAQFQADKHLYKERFWQKLTYE